MYTPIILWQGEPGPLGIHSLKLTARPWKWAIPKGNNRIPTIHFQGRTVSFREGSMLYSYLKHANQPSQNHNCIQVCRPPTTWLMTWAPHVIQFICIPDTQMKRVYLLYLPASTPTKFPKCEKIDQPCWVLSMFFVCIRIYIYIYTHTLWETNGKWVSTFRTIHLQMVHFSPCYFTRVSFYCITGLFWFSSIDIYGQIIATLHDLTSKGSWGREIPFFTKI